MTTANHTAPRRIPERAPGLPELRQSVQDFLAALNVAAESTVTIPAAPGRRVISIVGCEASLRDLYAGLAAARGYQIVDDEHYSPIDQQIYEDGKLVAVLWTGEPTTAEDRVSTDGNLHMRMVAPEEPAAGPEDVLPEITRPATNEELAEAIVGAIRVTEPDGPGDSPAARPAPRAPRHFDDPRIRALSFPFLRDVADVLLTSNGTQVEADKLMPKLEGADLAVVDAIRDAANSVSAFAEQALARILLLVWQRDHEFREPFRGSRAPWKPCGAVLDQFIVWVTPGTYEGAPAYDSEDAEVVIAHNEDFRSDEDEAEFMAKAPRRMVELRSNRATVMSPEELAEAAR